MTVEDIFYLMNKTLKFAAVDIGSNAVRLLLTKVIENSDHALFKKESLVRIPIRLGEDAFVDQLISREKETQLIETMIGFSHLIQAYEPVDHMICATSAMREAGNSAEIIAEVSRLSGLEIKSKEGAKGQRHKGA